MEEKMSEQKQDGPDVDSGVVLDDDLDAGFDPDDLGEDDGDAVKEGLVEKYEAEEPSVEEASAQSAASASSADEAGAATGADDAETGGE